jgi:hypothetical protein
LLRASEPTPRSVAGTDGNLSECRGRLPCGGVTVERMRAGCREILFERDASPSRGPLALNPLPAEPFDLSQWSRARVNIDYHIDFDANFYSVPYNFCAGPGGSAFDTCLVSFTDNEGIWHSAEVKASTLYEAAALTIAEFRRCGFHGECARTGKTAHHHGENAGHVARGSPQQDRGVAGDRRAESERAGNEGPAEGTAWVVITIGSRTAARWPIPAR